MMRFVGRVMVCALGVTAIRVGDHAPWWGDIALILIGLMLIGSVERDRQEA